MGKKAAIGLIIIIGVAGGIAGWYFFLRPKEADYSGLLLLPLLLPELPTPPVEIESSLVNNTNHGIGIFAGVAMGCLVYFSWSGSPDIDEHEPYRPADYGVG